MPGAYGETGSRSRKQAGELALPEQGWKLVWNRSSSPVLQNAVQDFQDYLDKSMRVQVEVEGRDSLEDWRTLGKSIVVGTRGHLPGCGTALKGPKDYEIVATPERLTVCGYDERGAMYGLYNLEARMNLREAPSCPGLKDGRHSLYDVRMVQSWMGWMEFPDRVLSHLAHDGFDGIFASALANPNGDRTTAESSTDFYARILFRMRKHGPDAGPDQPGFALRHQGLHADHLPVPGDPRKRSGAAPAGGDIVKEFPDIQGYVSSRKASGTRNGEEVTAPARSTCGTGRNWSRAVGIVAEECHRVNPAIEILPWEYNIDFRPQNVEMKRYFIQQLPADTIRCSPGKTGRASRSTACKDTCATMR